MKSLAAGALVALSLLLCACVGSGRSGLARGDAVGNDVDVGKIVTVNQWAAQRHATVVWMNYPIRAKRMPSQG